jgi:hypothetical protein
VIRGGYWGNDPANCHAANRNYNTPDNRNNNIGFRLASAPPASGWISPCWRNRCSSRPQAAAWGKTEITALVLVAPLAG